MDSDRFTLEGRTYFQEYRTCGKPGCGCKEDETKRHGPYWYMCNEHGRRKYVGKKLPARIADARRAIINRRDEIYALYLQRRADAAALERLHRREPLQDGDDLIIARLGFSDCLTEPFATPLDDLDLTAIDVRPEPQGRHFAMTAEDGVLLGYHPDRTVVVRFYRFAGGLGVDDPRDIPDADVDLVVAELDRRKNGPGTPVYHGTFAQALAEAKEIGP